MSNTPRKITIRQDEIAPSERLTVSPADILGGRPPKHTGKGETSSSSAQPACAHSGAGSTTTTSVARGRWTAWQRVWLTIVLLLALAVGAVVMFLLQSWLTPQDWVERIGERADDSVVFVQGNSAEGTKLGTGFVVSSHGNRHLVLTNRHVVDQVSGLSCRLRSGAEYPCEVAGLPRDPQIDLALLVIESPGLRPMGPLRAFEKVKAGEQVVAVGHPLGLEYTLTTGIVSAKREGLLLQTSAAISQGNSGGPLIDRRGRVLGVNTSYFANGQLLCFAVRADLVCNQAEWLYRVDVSDLVSRIER